MQYYRVGKPVRDRLLDLSVESNEWVVVGADHDTMLAQGFQSLDVSAGLYRDPQTDEPYQLARREVREYNSGSTILEISARADLDSELAIRDLTIHAMALDDQDHLIDPFDGEEDLQNGLLRHVTPHFARHPDYLLNIGVEAACLVKWGFHIAHGTYGLLKRMVAEGRVEQLPPASWAEAIRATLVEGATPSECFRVWQRCGALATISPSLDQLYDKEQAHESEQRSPGALAWLDEAVRAGRGREQILGDWHARLGKDAEVIYHQLGI
ncbi:hypothetical protein [Thiohalophilus thiocyanatoxydans]|uniref:Poly(A) polymerase-like protein n=1 Tax=Thiohalophilus thiocyanatoxydans TaxID=381308 RepID=A0A4R8ITF5_9GAMM|nr:hypothetical protein [Thiohalophilus thiocyanatoxydans]TDY00957.1 poly(A) polymerase-like protein [Thiohalophilus thiocyanatoxydans]